MDQNPEIIISPKTQKSQYKDRVLEHMLNATPLRRKLTENQARNKVAKELKHMRKKISNSLFIEQRKKLAEAESKSIKDALTGLYSRRYIMGDENQPNPSGELKRLFLEAQRSGDSLSLIFIDGDYFKNVNDTYGHQAGDDVLQALACELKTISRESDVVGRYGGEEFLILAQDTNLTQALDLGERIRMQIMEHNFSSNNISNRPRNMTVSVGVATFSPANEGFSINSESDLLGLADKAVYLAKSSGRNVVKSMLDLPKNNA
ncbi:hypothetical protein A2767_02115 [Candidatus Roizmanbacteria bacterium RIFCSPHIGHO2_01_FULL_35_10]|uniref:GGDEF domain-containing protein n=1 Tax=Candidatus Roizmanbacteria bacterium RIFCSPLOWO2_01_FULL_35_13 TaxID=1802055 RepID=A0A1F7I7C2_9BACT|nr:MAG: hypothetical protein A2767_02115 [Candidatus Roizmanbacteria bacterium RIFCSPHIGHO2_01_FULL_35_10]OGK39256.1 MAG: hypothetical protein A3A74_07535 [Candidatus Roizmanbacteria bacterium RIFCSPLOWO2_01_FULL_35_13]